MITRSKEWRVAGLFSHDISYCSRHVNKVCRINFSSGAKAVFRNMGPHFTTKVITIPAHASAHPPSGSFTPVGTLVTTSTSPMSNKRSHKFTVTQPRLIKTKLEEAFMSVQHDDVSICCLQHPFPFYSLTDWNSVLNTMTAMTAFLEIYVTGAQAELFFCRYVEDIRCFFLYHMAVLVQEAWTNHFNPALVTVADGMTVTVGFKDVFVRR